jgi:hypothetical protein
LGATLLERARVDVNRVNGVSQTDANLSILTAEGDRVTLSSSVNTEFLFTQYDAQGQSRNFQIDASGQFVEVSGSREISLSVEGDLSDEELADIHDLINSFDEMISDLTSGDGDEAEFNVDFDELGSIAVVSTSFEQHRELEATTVIKERTESADDSSNQSDEVEHEKPKMHRGLGPLVRQMVKAAQESRDDIKKLGKNMAKMSKHVLHEVGKRHGLEGREFRLASKIMSSLGREISHLAHGSRGTDD